MKVLKLRPVNPIYKHKSPLNLVLRCSSFLPFPFSRIRRHPIAEKYRRNTSDWTYRELSCNLGFTSRTSDKPPLSTTGFFSRKSNIPLPAAPSTLHSQRKKKNKKNPKTDQHTEPNKEKRDKFDENEDLWLGFGLRLREERRLGCGVLRIGYRGRRGRWWSHWIYKCKLRRGQWPFSVLWALVKLWSRVRRGPQRSGPSGENFRPSDFHI